MELDELRQLLKSKREAAKHSFNQGEVQAVICMINKKQNDMMKEAEREEVNKQEMEEELGGSQLLYRHRQLQEEVRIGMRRGGTEDLRQQQRKQQPRALQQELEIQLQPNDQQHEHQVCQEVDVLIKTDENDAPPAMMPIIKKAYLQCLNANLELEQTYPPGCPVWFSSTSDQRNCTFEAYQGVVKANYINMRSKSREIVCEIEYNNNDMDTCDQIFVYEEQLHFASKCPVQVTGISGVGYICPQFPPSTNKTYAIQFSTSGGSRVTGIYNVDPKEVVYVPSKLCNDDGNERTVDTTFSNIEETENSISTGVEQEINITNNNVDDNVDEQPSTVQIQQTSLEVPTVESENSNNKADEHSLAKDPLTIPDKGKSQKEMTEMCLKDISSPSEGITFNCPSCTKDYFYRSVQTAKASFANHRKKCLLKNGDADESDGKLSRCNSNSEQVEAGTAQPKYSIDTVVSKVFHLNDEGVDCSFSGKVSAYDFKEGFYSITYEDGDEEEMNEMELEEIVVGIEMTNKQQGKKKDKSTTKKRKKMCGNCVACLRDECGKCVYCKDMVKFGGKGYLRQKCLLRKCLNPTFPIFTNKAEDGNNELVKLNQQRVTVDDNAATIIFERQEIDTNDMAVELRVPRLPPIPGHDEQQSKVDIKRRRTFPKNYAEDEKDNVECDVEVKKTDDDDNNGEVLYAATSTSATLPSRIAVPPLTVGQTELTVPCPEIGIGWRQRVVVRKSAIGSGENFGNSKIVKDRYFYPPPTIDGKEGTMFRSLVEVKRYLHSNTEATKTIKTKKEKKVIDDENELMDENEEEIVPLHVPRKQVSIRDNSDIDQLGLSLLSPKRLIRSTDLILDKSILSVHEEHNESSKNPDMDMVRQLKVATSSEISQNQNGSPLGKGQELTCILTVPLWVERSAKKDLFAHLFGQGKVIYGYKCTEMSYKLKTSVHLCRRDRKKRTPWEITISTKTGEINNLLYAKRLIMESIIEFLADSDSERRLVYQMEISAGGIFPIKKVDHVVKARCHRLKRLVWMNVLRLRCPESVTSLLFSEESQRQLTSGTNCEIELHGLSKDSFGDPYVYIHGNRSDEVVKVSERISRKVNHEKNVSPSRKGELRKRKVSSELRTPSGSMELIDNRPRKASKFTQEQRVTDNSGVNDVLGTDSNLSNKSRRPHTIKLHIGNLSSSTQPSMLHEYFTDLHGYASVLECVIPPGPYPYGSVTMLEEYARDVLKCGQKHELDGRVLKVTKSVPIDEKPVKTPVSPSSLRCPNCGYHSRWCTCIPLFVPYTATASYNTQQQQGENLSTDLENPEMKPRIKLPDGWACIWSKSQKRWYFFHSRTNKSVWDIEVICNKS